MLIGGQSPDYANHTATTVTVNNQPETVSEPNEVCRLNNKPLGVANPDPIGAGIMLWIHPGDVIKAEVHAKYADFDPADQNIIGGLTGFLTSAMGANPLAIDGPSIFSVVNEPGFALLPAWDKLDDNQPRAKEIKISYEQANQVLQDRKKALNTHCELHEFVNRSLVLLSEPNRFYSEADLPTKRLVVESLFEGKLIYLENQFSAVFNEGLRLIVRSAA